MSDFLDAIAANEAEPQTQANGTIVVYARDPKNHEPTDADRRNAARNLFVGFQFALAYNATVTTTTMDLTKFPDATKQAFRDVAGDMAQAIDTIPAYVVSTEYCSKQQAKVVTEFAAGKHLVGTDAGSHRLQRAGIAKATVVPSVASLKA
jgi:hypothetical protein